MEVTCIHSCSVSKSNKLLGSPGWILMESYFGLSVVVEVGRFLPKEHWPHSCPFSHLSDEETSGHGRGWWSQNAEHTPLKWAHWLPQVCLIGPHKSQAQLNPVICFSAITPSLSPRGGGWVASSNAESCASEMLWVGPEETSLQHTLGEGPGSRALLSLWSGPQRLAGSQTPAQSCFGYWGCNVSVESVQKEKGVPAGRRGVVREARGGVG